MSVPLCYYGSPEPPPERQEVHCGPWEVVLEAGDLRYVQYGGVEVCRRWYAAVRDQDWGTVPGVVTSQSVSHQNDTVAIDFVAEHRAGDAHFVWRGEIRIDAAGTIAFTFDGEAKAAFRRNRIGFCVLHPVRECAGASATLHHPGGTATTTRFPEFIAPDNPFRGLTGLDHALPGGGSAAWRFDGDVFETEDQRNWIDASFKTFCTPLSLPFPVDVKAGDRVRQTVTLTVHRTGTTAKVDAPPAPALVVRSGEVVARLPEIGLGMASHGRPFDAGDIERLKGLRPAHLRAEIDLTRDGWRQRLRLAVVDATAVGAGLELAVTVSDRVWDETASLIPVLHELTVPVARVLAFHDREWATPERIVVPLTEALARAGVDAPVFAGTTANFTELNRGRPVLPGPAGVCYSIHPQEHAFDNASLAQTCAVVADTVRSARRLGGDRPVAVTPVTLRKRVNPYATGPAAPVPPGEPPPTVDPRQMSLFGAGWTLGTLKSLAESGVASATFYETTGWLGVVESAAGCPLADRFPSRPGMAFPLYHVLADATEFAGADVVPATSTQPLGFEGLALRRGGETRVMVANLTHEPVTLTVRGLGRRAAVRLLDETTFERATADPAGFRADPGVDHPTPGGELTLALRPFAYARLDADGATP